MKTSSPYPVLDNRPIDQWKVTELKDELKRRKLTTKGLKDDLVRRLDEALREELDSVKEDNAKDFHGTPQPVVHADDVRGFNDSPQLVATIDDVGVLVDTPQQVVQTEDVGVLDGTIQPVTSVEGEGETAISGISESMTNHCNNEDTKGIGCGDSGINEESVVVTSVETSTMVKEVLPGEGVVQDGEGTGADDSAKNSETVVYVTSVETSITITESVGDGVAMDVQESLENDVQSMRDELKAQLENQGTGTPKDVELGFSDSSNRDSEVSTDMSFQVTQLEYEEAKPLEDDAKLNSSYPRNQVSEVSKSDSISTDCITNNQKNELKDNIIADSVKLELDVKPEMVHPSSSSILSDGSEPHPMDVEEPCDTKEPVKNVDEIACSEIKKKNDSLDLGSSEKLNLDQSSGDDSMDADTMESKQTDLKYKSKGEDQDKKVEGSVMEEAPVVMSNNISAEQNDIEKVAAATLLKRKLSVVGKGNNDISKRQRRWNTESLKAPEPLSNTAVSTPKGMSSSTPLKQSFSRSNSTAIEETPKERVVPPSPKPPTTSLRIDQFVRPFTLKAVQDLLGKTGSVTSFWMDNIKTHCYVSYSTVEEAVKTRDAVYNLQWPLNGGRLLVAEFVNPQEVKARVEAPPNVTTPTGLGPTLKPKPPATTQLLRQQVQRQQVLPPPPSLPLPLLPPLLNPLQTREKLPPPPPMEKLEKVDIPIITLDDLFRKTKETPRIYYLPLTDEQVAAKRTKTKQ